MYNSISEFLTKHNAWKEGEKIEWEGKPDKAVNKRVARVFASVILIICLGLSSLFILQGKLWWFAGFSAASIILDALFYYFATTRSILIMYALTNMRLMSFDGRGMFVSDYDEIGEVKTAPLRGHPGIGTVRAALEGRYGMKHTFTSIPEPETVAQLIKDKSAAAKDKNAQGNKDN